MSGAGGTGEMGASGHDRQLGVPAGKVRLIEYNPAWPGDFARERDRIATALADLSVTIEHVGSTAVPGMTAKPLIDMMVGIPDIAWHARAIAPLEAIGYAYKGEYGIPDRHFFVLGDPTTHHVHLVQYGGHFWHLNLAFRDHLRAVADARTRYTDEKVRLHAAFPDSREKYTAGKDAIIRELLKEAGWVG